MDARRLLLCALVLSFAGCGGGVESGGPDAGGGGDDAAGMDALPPPDGGAPATCTTDLDCDDGRFCDGEERCMPGATDADDTGCVVATESPCVAGEECDEVANTCDAICVDGDSDGHGDLACGGDDCDDADANRYPGNVEVCDMAAHDEDCNTETFGFLDADSDGAASRVCCNVQAGGALGCGTDCNDGDATVNPRAGDGPPLFCDGVDNDCSGTSDEGCPCVEGETRECGTDPQLMRIGVCRPGTQVCSGGAFTDTCIGAISPDAEVCDAFDNDCDGTVDDGVLRTYYPDVDTDGFGTSAGTPAMACSAPSGYSSNDIDCDDARPSVNPGATEVCNGVDDNCTGGTDEGFVGTFYRDLDGDGFGDAAMATMSCAPPTGYVRNATDCDDSNGSRNPATLEACNGLDDNCNGMTDEGVTRTFYADTDGDAWGVAGTTTSACTAPAGYADRSGDCDDTRASANPAGTEVCNGFDDNCAGGVDEGVLRTFYRDADRDSFGVDDATMTACTAPSGHSDRGGDCLDTSASVNPAAAEACNGRDDNCDGATDTGCTCTDGANRTCGPSSEVGECTFGTQTCVAGTWGGCVGAVSPTAESCNGLDDDCDGAADNGVTVTGCYRDGDGDGYGTGGATSQCRDVARGAFGFCPPGWVNNATDCNDGVGAIRPGATETCDGIDQDCDGMADEGATIACYGDADADGFGAGAGVQRCADPARTAFGMCPSGYTNVATDCNDGASTVRPGAPELCNDVDDDCDMTVDDGVSASPCHADADGDGYGTGPAVTRCRDATRMAQGYCPVGYTNVATDCNDGSSSIRPGGTEVCNGLDDDCDGTPDEMLTASTCYVDRDADGYGTGSASAQCRDAARASDGYCPVGYTDAAGDCNDSNGGAYPMASEICNGVDDDCDGTNDDGVTVSCYADADADGYGTGTATTRCRDDARMAQGYCPVGYTATAGDCNDGASGVRPGATEVCNGIDDNCAGGTDEALTVSGCYPDVDGDNYGRAGAAATSQCRDAARAANGFCPAGYDSDVLDCNDANAAVRPGATESCNGADDDCDGTADDGVTISCYADADGDAYGAGSIVPRCPDSARAMTYGSCPVGYTATVGDCNDGASSVRPGATEVCNGVDDDCEGGTDEMLTIATCHPDVDGDNYGRAGSAATSQCRDAARAANGECPVGYDSDTMDCNDANASVRPGAAETCNGGDDDCDGTADNGVTISCYADADGDAYGAGAIVARCPDAARAMTYGSCPVGYTATVGDCNDGASAVRPGATEVCNGVDDDCEGGTDEMLTVAMCFPDVDGDDYGRSGSTATSQCRDLGRMANGYCPAGYDSDSADCNDGNGAVRPSATETCNGVDDDCDGTADDGVTVSCYADADGDGSGTGSTVSRCRDAARAMYGECPVGYTNTAGDCNDGNAGTRPGTTETCNGIDDNCVGGVDEGVTATGCYPDVDADGYGRTTATASTQCRDAMRVANGYCPTGYDNDNLDCNDLNAGVRPSATEICDMADQDCDGTADDGVTQQFFPDADGDGYGALTRSGPSTCDPVAGYTRTTGDCNDVAGTGAGIHPGAAELCNGVDDNCVGGTDEAPPAAAQCSGANPSAVHVLSWACSAATCVPSCGGAWRDCDGISANGCETDSSTTEDHCGSCGNSCGTGGVCAASTCDTITDLVANGSNTCVVRSSGQLVCWGDGAAAQFLDPARVDELSPHLLTGISAVDSITIGDSNETGTPQLTLYARQANVLIAWGQNTGYEVGNGNTISPVATATAVLSYSSGLGIMGAGVDHVCQRFGSGSVTCWGLNPWGELGEYDADTYVVAPNTLTPQLTGYSDLAGGYQYTCGIRSSAPTGLRCWGRSGATGRLGDGSTGFTEIPVIVTIPATFTAPVDVEVGLDHACARGTGDATHSNVICWGEGADGRIGHNASTDALTAAHVYYAPGWPLTYSQIAPGGNHTCGISSTAGSSGTLWCWGDNLYGQLGTGTGLDDDDPAQVPGLANVVDVAVGNWHTCARLASGDVYCWGRNDQGQLGLGDTVTRPTPFLVPGF